MGFSRKRKITHVFKIMDGIDLVNSQDILQGNAFVTHALSAPFWKWADYANFLSCLIPL